ncbi:unnamed protein product [Spodoptera exigua]|nr:unnamed protein product [Spodoptera exigua]
MDQVFHKTTIGMSQGSDSCALKTWKLHKLALESGELYQQHGSGDSAASVLGKTAKIIEEASPELAVELFQMAADASAARQLRNAQRKNFVINGFSESSPSLGWTSTVESLYRDNIRSRSEHVWDSATASTSRPRIPPTATATTSQQADEMMHQALRGRVQAVQNEHDRETAAIDRELKRLDEDLDRRLKALHDQFTQVSETERPEEVTEPDVPPEIPELLPNETSVVALDPQPGPSTSQAGFSLAQPDEVLANLQVILHDENAMDSGVSDNPGPSFANHPRQNFFEEFQRRLSQDLNIQLTVPEILLNFGNPPDQRVLDDFIRRVEEGASSGLTQADQTGSDHRPRRTFIDEFQR